MREADKGFIQSIAETLGQNAGRPIGIASCLELKYFYEPKGAGHIYNF